MALSGHRWVGRILNDDIGAIAARGGREALEAVVALDGVVPTEAERDMAEHDAWYVFGVEDVVNRIEVRR